MTLLHAVNPETFIDAASGKPANGRGAWTKTGIDFEYRYALSKDPAQRIGTRAEVSLAHWAVAAGSFAIQQRLVNLGFLAPLADSERGIFGPRTEQAVKDFQSVSSDPQGGRALTVDGVFGTSDARALWTPLISAFQTNYGIPHRLLLGQSNHESVLDPGAVGYYIFYPDYRGVDRGMSQINSKAQSQVTWLQAFDPVFAIEWSAKRMRDYFAQFKAANPKQSDDVLWDAAACAHNSPANGAKWAAQGSAPNEAAATYMDAVRKSVF